MAWRDRLSAMFSRRKPRDVDFRIWDSIIQQVNAYLSESKVGNVTDLLEQHRKSNLLVIGICDSIETWMHKVMATPEDAARREVLKMIDALRKTSFVKKEVKSLAGTTIYTNNPVLSTLAMHTFLLNEYLQHKNSKLRKPSKSEVEAALRIVENHFRKDTTRQLLDLVATQGRKLPTHYVASINGWLGEVGRLRDLHEKMNTSINPQEVGQLREQLWPIENRLVRASERILETNIVVLPPTYMQKLEEELDALGWFARFPEKVDSPGSRMFLDKYGIQPDKPYAVRCRQIEEAFRKLDERLVRMSGRKPYADELFASLKREEPKAAEKKDHSNVHDWEPRQSETSHSEQPSRKIRR